DRITTRMRRADRVGRTVTLRFRFDDFSRATRSHSLGDATAGTGTVHATAVALLDAAWPLVDAKGITLLGVSVGNLSDLDAVQLTLPFRRCDSDQLDDIVDAVRDRFGSGALQRAATMRGDPGIQMPMLAD
ncbi:MAG TPA: DNA polymerase IV, partial [Ilumatobacteraceae bacterium]|nr:DNA polymerase IV [Ilumatobacteraceae bacterium]